MMSSYMKPAKMMKRPMGKVMGLKKPGLVGGPSMTPGQAFIQKEKEMNRKKKMAGVMPKKY